ncbi:hypothetical protein [Massilia sp. METH4]|uniref:hypothetical protein n=1 Tax=Massilia sp. METH4 TaxID=3123041 RepID=UPI0030D18B50
MTDPSTSAEAGLALEVTFDGHHYHFRQYRYEHLDDALRYARSQHAKPGYERDASFVPQWLPEWTPDAAQRAAMRELSIGFDHGRFSVGPYRYDRLEDALAYARHGRSA